MAEKEIQGGRLKYTEQEQPSDLICKFKKECNTLVNRNTPVPAPQVTE